MQVLQFRIFRYVQLLYIHKFLALEILQLSEGAQV